ncbi:MAG TPA: hypothetical protein VKE74_22720 [Gemmataceae bacterium]|nr:hypothetical protein [Gemmataceae bacterium]
MSLSSEAQNLADRYLRALIEAVRPLQEGPDPEVALEALIEAARLLRERLRAELAELRKEQVD